MANFKGFKPIDFDGIDGTTWRSREALGGDVIGTIGSEFQSWVVYGRQVLQIGPAADGQPEPESAKLFVHTDSNGGGGLAYGLYVESHGDRKNPHWQNLVDGLSKGDRMRRSLATAIEKHDLTFGKYAGGEENDPKWRFQSEGGRVHRVDGRKRTDTTLDDLIGEIVKLPRGNWVDLYVYDRMSKGDAIAAGASVVEPVSKLLLTLVPFYCQILYD